MTYGDLLEYLRPLTDNDLGKTAQVLVRSGLGRSFGSIQATAMIRRCRHLG